VIWKRRAPHHTQKINVVMDSKEMKNSKDATLVVIP
jgi:hypothetical protein